jgi:hypothetical protein
MEAFIKSNFTLSQDQASKLFHLTSEELSALEEKLGSYDGFNELAEEQK